VVGNRNGCFGTEEAPGHLPESTGTLWRCGRNRGEHTGRESKRRQERDLCSQAAASLHTPLIRVREETHPAIRLFLQPLCLRSITKSTVGAWLASAETRKGELCCSPRVIQGGPLLLWGSHILSQHRNQLSSSGANSHPYMYKPLPPTQRHHKLERETCHVAMAIQRPFPKGNRTKPAHHRPPPVSPWLQTHTGFISTWCGTQRPRIPSHSLHVPQPRVLARVMTP
jgi:hypothetical protein